MILSSIVSEDQRLITIKNVNNNLNISSILPHNY